METTFLRCIGILVFGPLAGSLPLDIAPPAAAAGLSAALLAALCGLVVVIGVAAFFVIRAIKKNQAGKDRS
jgi:hypothetical protein